MERISSNSHEFEPATPIRVGSTFAAVFVDNRLPGVDPLFQSLEQSLATMTRLSDAQTMAVIGKIDDTPEMIEARKGFLKAVRKYEKKTGTISSLTDTNSDEQQWWSDLLVSMEGILATYQDMKDQKSGRLLRKCLRKCADLQKPVNHWLKLLPSESWQGSLVCGGIKVIFAAAARLRDVREDIADAIQQIPVAICRAQQFTSQYTKSELLKSHVSQLYVAILDVLGHCLSFFAQGSGKRAMGSILKGDGFGAELADKCKQLQRLESSIDKVADMNLHKSVGDANDSLDLVQEKLNVTYWQMKQLERTVKGAIGMLLVDQEERFQRHQAWEQQRRAQAERKRQKRLRRSREVKAQLQDSLVVDVERRDRDVATTLRDGYVLSHTTQRRAAWIQESPQFSQWLSTPASNILVVHGNEAQHSRQSSVSFLAASVMCGLDDNHAGLHLSWFGSQNIHAKASDVVSDLIYQIFEAGLKDAPSSLLDQASTSNPHNFEDLRDLLVKALQAQLQESSVFIIIDAVSFYEDRSRRRDMHALLDDFVWLVDSVQDKGYPLKILISSPVRSQWPDDELANGSALSVLNVASSVGGVLESVDTKLLASDLQQAAPGADREQQDDSESEDDQVRA